MLAKLRAKLCCSSADGNADEAEPAIFHANPSINEERLEPKSNTPFDVFNTPSTHGVAEPKDLWKVAFDGLDPTRKFWFSNEQPPAEEIQKVISETEKRYEEYQTGGLLIRRPDGKEIKVREITQKILASALTAQEVVKTIVSFDQSGYGGFTSISASCTAA
ncbi:uncharacterized protein LDX57_007182 [Aspergillus melleus]|uniref:uncharacterized protein n=1 Tax=Aspergillus melleus TaxID=138277 RepID=UPI001E8DBDE0|nr:uncharacterized protein LDX57_007182 [Aspergillus melleus]KAH8429520.1 hypothetical protein LDX57_007182 [Aspergillus melleus]